MGKEGLITVSHTMLNDYFHCPAYFFFKRMPRLAEKTNYALICGKLVHKLIARLYDTPANSDRPFYYQTLENLVGRVVNEKREEKVARKVEGGVWKHEYWSEVIAAREANGLVRPSQISEWNYFDIGRKCLEKYWQSNFSKPRPLLIEKKYTHYLSPDIIAPRGVYLTGVFDQVRTVPISFIERNRPGIVVDGRLKEGFDPVMILDLKTDKYDYTPSNAFEDATIEDWAEAQYSLHHSYQPTIYTDLYRRTFGREPALFGWYHLRTGRIFVTHRERADVQNLYMAIQHLVDNIEALSFPKFYERRKCDNCGYQKPCNEDRSILVSLPSEFPSIDAISTSLKPQVSLVPKQKRMKLTSPRRSRGLPVAITLTQEDIEFNLLPWDRNPNPDVLVV